MVYEEGSIGRVATRTGATQPGLSVHISALESELGVKLFRRHARGVEPTPEGKQLYKRGIRLLYEANNVEQEIAALSGTVTGAVSAGISPALGRAVLGRVLFEFVGRFPNVKLKVSEDYSSTLLSLVEAGALDFAILMHTPIHPTIRFKHFYKDHFVIVSSRRLGLTPGKPIRLDTAPFYKFVVPSVHHGLQSALEVPFRAGQIVSDRVLEVNSLAGVLDFVSVSDWLALLPYTSVHVGLDTTQLQINPIAGTEVPINYYIAYAASAPLSAAANVFSDITRVELSKIQASAVKWLPRTSASKVAKKTKRGSKRQEKGRRRKT